ncbi:MAG: metallophosphoesterase [Halioglobus sp.]|nr:metallophosphoesterase [Halioglobus sp.]
MPQRFAQLSDPHLSTLHRVRAKDLLNKRALGYLSWLRKRRFEHRREVLDALQQDLNLDHLDQLLVTGDLTHIGLPAEFEEARAWLEQLGDSTRVALVPGNHDACVAAPWNDTFGLWRAYMSSDKDSGLAPGFPTLRVRGDIAFIGLSTGCPKLPLMATGTLGRVQLCRLPALLDQTAQRGLFRVIYLHHSPLAGEEKWRKRLTDAKAIQTLLVDKGAELVLHGHGHRAHYRNLETRCGLLPIIAQPSASALGLYGADIAHYNRYTVCRKSNGWQLNIEERRYDRASGLCQSGAAQTLQLERTMQQ